MSSKLRVLDVKHALELLVAEIEMENPKPKYEYRSGRIEALLYEIDKILTEFRSIDFGDE